MKMEFNTNMDHFDAILVLRYGIDAYDREYDRLSRIGRVPVTETVGQVDLMQADAWGHRWVPLWFVLGRMAGVAVVWQRGGPLTAVGREVGLEGWDMARQAVRRAARREDRAQLYGAALRALRPSCDALHRAQRIGLASVQHRTTQAFPDLREWRPSLPGEPEVLLKAAHGGLHLGGAVWTDAYYESGQVLKDLRLRVL